jgi:hypothetical protein
MTQLKRVHTDSAPAAIGPYSQAIIANGLVYTAGQIPLDPATMELVGGDDVAAQTEQVMRNLAPSSTRRRVALERREDHGVPGGHERLRRHERGLWPPLRRAPAGALHRQVSPAEGRGSNRGGRRRRRNRVVAVAGQSSSCHTNAPGPGPRCVASTGLAGAMMVSRSPNVCRSSPQTAPPSPRSRRAPRRNAAAARRGTRSTSSAQHPASTLPLPRTLASGWTRPSARGRGWAGCRAARQS